MVVLVVFFGGGRGGNSMLFDMRFLCVFLNADSLEEEEDDDDDDEEVFTSPPTLTLKYGEDSLPKATPFSTVLLLLFPPLILKEEERGIVLQAIHRLADLSFSKVHVLQAHPPSSSEESIFMVSEVLFIFGQVIGRLNVIF